MKRVFWLAALFLLVLLAGAARCWSLRDTFIEGKIHFADPDCYSRMTRARLVSEGQALSIRYHSFENHPQGIRPHTTAPMDFAVVGLHGVLGVVQRWFDPQGASVLHGQTLDLAGALIGPLLGMLLCAAVGVALPPHEGGDIGARLGAVLLLAVSPILVHGTLLGRPDHQALLIPLVGFALAADFRLLQAPSVRWAVAAGLAWGLALWTSLYEPLILFLLSLAGLALAQPKAFGRRLRYWEWGLALAVLLLGMLVDGWRLSAPDAALREAFARWSTSIGELRPLDWRSGTLRQWLGWAGLIIPVALACQVRRDGAARLGLLLFGVTLALTFWQLRWGYFLALVAAVVLPVAFRVTTWRWAAGLVFVGGLWPVAAAWEAQLFPPDADLWRRIMWRREQVALRLIAEHQREAAAGPFLAPWWLAPATAYWSGQPGVTGSSHQSLPGILDSARIMLAPNAAEALPLLREREVAWILTDLPARIVPTAAAVLGRPVPEHCLAVDLYPSGQPALDTAPLILENEMPHPLGENPFRVWRVPREPSVPSDSAK